MITGIEIVPIGKYKGKPVEALMADQPYSEWLLAQAWFVDRYAELAQLLRMGRLSEPQDTPEHNAMVAGLIDQRDAMEILAEGLLSDEEIYCAQMSQEVEPKGGDLRIRFDFLELLIEAKPLIGDDFPSVIRQVKAGVTSTHNSYARAVVIARRVEPSNLSVAQIRRQFDLSGVRLVLEAEFFEAGRQQAVKRHAYLNQTIAAVATEIEALSADLADAQKASDDERHRWDWTRNTDKLAEKISARKQRLSRLREAQANA